jgi:hypothetical protein
VRRFTQKVRPLRIAPPAQSPRFWQNDNPVQQLSVFHVTKSVNFLDSCPECKELSVVYGLKYVA